MARRLAGFVGLCVFIHACWSFNALADVTGSFDLHLFLEPESTQIEAVKYKIDVQSNLIVNVTISGLTFGPDLGMGTTGIEFSILNLIGRLGALTLREQVVFATPFVSLDVSNLPSQIVPTINAPGAFNGVAFVSSRLTTELNVAGVSLRNEAIFEDVDFHGPFDVPDRNLDNGDVNGDGCPGVCGVDEDLDGQTDEGNVNNDDEDELLVAPFTERVDEDPLGDANLDGCPGRCGVDDDVDGSIDEGSVDDDDEDGLVDEDQGDALFDEDPFGDANGDGCPGVCGVDDDNDGVADEGPVDDDDEDGFIDEDLGKTVYFMGQVNNVPGDQTPSFAFGDRFTVLGQTVSGINVTSSVGLCFSTTPKQIKKRSFNGSVNPGCVWDVLPPEKSGFFFDFLNLKVQNVSIGGLVLGMTGEWKPLEASTLVFDATLGLFGIANLRVSYETQHLTDLTVSNALTLNFVGQNFQLSIVDADADLDFESISFNTRLTFNGRTDPVTVSSSTGVSKGSGITSQSINLSYTRSPLLFSATTSFNGSGTLSWQSTSFVLGGKFSDALNLRAELKFTPSGLSPATVKIGVVF